MTKKEQKSLYEKIMRDISKSIKKQLNEERVDYNDVIKVKQILRKLGFKQYEQPENVWHLDNYETNDRYIFRDGWAIVEYYETGFYFCKKTAAGYV